MVKSPTASSGDAGDMGLIPGLGRSTGKGNDNPLQYSCLGKSYGQRRLAGYSPCGRKQSDMTEATYHTTHIYVCMCGVCIYIDGASLVAPLVKNPAALLETPGRFLGWGDPLEKG